MNDTDGLTLSNEALLDFRAWLISQGVSSGDVAEINKNAISGKGVYNWSSDLTVTDYWMLKSMGVNYQDSTKQNYVPVQQIDAGNLPGGVSLQYLRQNQSKTNPLLLLEGNSFEIIPAPTSPDNLTSFFNILYFQAPTSYVSVSSAIVYPESLDDLTLAYRIAAIHSLRKGSGMFTELNKEYLKRANRILQIIRQGTQTPLFPKGINWTGWGF